MMQLDGLACAAEADDLVFAATGAERPDPDAIWIGRWTSNGWSGWSGIGQPARGALPCRPALVYGDQRVVEIVVSGHDGAVWHASQAQPGAAGWLGWQSLGKPGGKPVITGHQGAHAPDASPVLALNLDGSLEVSVVRSDLSVWHRHRQLDGGPTGRHWAVPAARTPGRWGHSPRPPTPRTAAWNCSPLTATAGSSTAGRSSPAATGRAGNRWAVPAGSQRAAWPRP